MTYTVSVEPASDLDVGWRDLLSRSDRPTVFQHPAWQAVWWEIFGDASQRVCYAVRDEAGTLAAVAPMLRLPDGSLSFGGDPEIMDYMDVVIAKGCEPAVVAALLGQWRSEGVPAVSLWGLRDGSPVLECLRGEGGQPVACEEEAVAPRIPLAADWEGYLATLSKKDRHELRRKMRRLEGAGMTVGFRALCEPGEIDAGLGDFFRLHTISRADKAEFMTPKMEGFFRRITRAFAEEGVVRLFLIDLDDKPAAALLAFEGEDLAVWNSGYDPEYASLSIGLYSKAKAIEWAIGRGHTRVDFLRGREPYKYDLGGVDLVVWRCGVRV